MPRRTPRFAPALAFGLFLIAFSAGAAVLPGDSSPVKPFQAEYDVLRNGKELGRATLTLRPLGDGAWEFSNQTHGTKGMASLLGLDVVEKSTFRWHDGQPEGLRYSYSQKAAVKSRERSTEFDWKAGEAQSNDGKNAYTARLEPGAMDRNLVTVALMAALKQNAHDLSFRVVDKDRIADQNYRESGRETLTLPAGQLEAVRVERQREDSKRTTVSWFAPQRNWLPVQIEQVEKSGETITLQLASQPKS